MAYSHDPVFAQTVHSAQATLVDAKATLSGVTTAVKLIAASDEGQCIIRLWALPKATLGTTLRVDWYVSPDGIAATLVGSITVGSQTVSATAAIAETQDTRWSSEEPLYLGPGQELWAGLSTAFAAGINVCAHHQKLTAPSAA